MSSQSSRLFKNSLVLSISAIISQLFSAISYLIVARSESPEKFGIIVSGVGAAILLISAVDFGMNSFAIRNLARNPDYTVVFDQVVSLKLTSGIIVCVLWTFITYGGLHILDNRLEWVPLGFYIILSTINSTLYVPFRAAERMGIVSVGVLIDKGFMAMTSFILVSFHFGTISLPISLCVGSLASAIISRIPSRRQTINFMFPKVRCSIYLMKLTSGFAMSDFMSQLQRIDVFVVLSLVGKLQAAYFAAPARFTGPLGIFSTAYSASLYPLIAKGWHNAKTRRNVLFQTSLVMALIVLFILGLYIFARNFTLNILGEKYLPAIMVFRVYFMAMIIVSLNQPLAVILQAIGHEKFVGIVVASATICSLIMVGIGAKLSGAYGASLGYLITNCLVLVSLFIKYYKSNLQFTNFNYCSLQSDNYENI